MSPTSPRFPQIPLHHVPVDTRPRVLHVSLERPLSLTRSAILQQAGYRVETALTAGEAARRLEEKDYQAVIVGHSLSREQKAQVIGAARVASSAPWIIGLYSLTATEAAGAHMAVDAQDGPPAVLAALQRMGSNTKRKPGHQKAKH